MTSFDDQNILIELSAKVASMETKTKEMESEVETMKKEKEAMNKAMEDMMGHKVALESRYERYEEDDFERFSEYQKIIPFLTISDDERMRLENEKLRQEKSELQKVKDNAKIMDWIVLQESKKTSDAVLAK